MAEVNAEGSDPAESDPELQELHDGQDGNDSRANISHRLPSFAAVCWRIATDLGQQEWPPPPPPGVYSSAPRCLSIVNERRVGSMYEKEEEAAGFPSYLELQRPGDKRSLSLNKSRGQPWGNIHENRTDVVM